MQARSTAMRKSQQELRKKENETPERSGRDAQHRPGWKATAADEKKEGKKKSVSESEMRNDTKKETCSCMCSV
jgi:hypothetical protein